MMIPEHIRIAWEKENNPFYPEDMIYTRENIDEILQIVLDQFQIFKSLTAKMRDEQKAYFKTRSKGALIAAKILEQKVDKALSEPIVEVTFKFPEDYETKRG